jgi:hypothetical protein
MKPSGRVKIIHAERDANRSTLPFCHLQNRKFAIHFSITSAENSIFFFPASYLSFQDMTSCLLPSFYVIWKYLVSILCFFYFTIL